MNYSDFKRRYSRASTGELMYLYARGGLLPDATRALEEVLRNRADFSEEELAEVEREIRSYNKKKTSNSNSQSTSSAQSNSPVQSNPSKYGILIGNILVGVALAAMIISLTPMIISLTPILLYAPEPGKCLSALLNKRAHRDNQEQVSQWCYGGDDTREEILSRLESKLGAGSGDRKAVPGSQEVPIREKIIGGWSCAYYLAEDAARMYGTLRVDYFSDGRASSTGSVKYQSEFIIPIDFELKESLRWFVKDGRLKEVTDDIEIGPPGNSAQHDMSADKDFLDSDDLVETYEVLELSETALVLRADSDGSEYGCSKASAMNGPVRVIQGVPAPVTLAGFTSGPPVNNESSGRDLVTSLPYASPGIMATVVIHGGGYQHLPGGSGSEQVLAEFESFTSEAIDNLRAGDNDQVEISKIEPMALTSGNDNFLGRRLDFSSDEGARSYYLFLTVFDNKILKVVVTSPSGDSSAGRVHAFLIAYTAILWPNSGLI